MAGAGGSLDCIPEKLPNTVSGLIAIAVSLVGSADGVMDVMGCSKDDFLQYCEGRQEPYLPELDRLIALIDREQAHIIAMNWELLAQIRTKSEGRQ